MITTISYPEGNGEAYEQFRYPGGEVQVRLFRPTINAIKAADEIHVVARIRDGEVMGLAQLTSAIQGVVPDTTRMILILPYLPYARADRYFVHGDCLGIKSFAFMINALQYDKVVTLDVHSAVARDYISDFINVSPRPLIVSATEDIINTTGTPPAILLPDKGAARYKLNGLQCDKIRDAKTGKLYGFIAPPKSAFGDSKSVLIIDDICDGGGTFIGIANELQDYGLDLYLYVTHGMFSKGFSELFKYFKRIYTTDSIISYISSGDSLNILPAHGVILEAILDKSDLWKNAAKAQSVII